MCVAGCNQSSSPSAVTAGLSGDFPDDNKPEDFASASNREVDAASMAMHWNEFRVVDMQPIGEFKHVLDMSDSGRPKRWAAGCVHAHLMDMVFADMSITCNNTLAGSSTLEVLMYFF